MNRTHSLIAAAVLTTSAALAGCSTNPSRQEVGTAAGAVVGGAAGAVITGGSTLGTVTGAAVGGVIGNRIGKDMDRSRN